MTSDDSGIGHLGLVIGHSQTMRCFIPTSEWSASRLIVNDDEAHHLIQVLRIKPGQPIEVFDGAGRSAQAEVEVIQKRRGHVPFYRTRR